jgi:hypothetical protein
MSPSETLLQHIYDQAARAILAGRVLTWTATPELCAAFKRISPASSDVPEQP